MDGCVFKIKFCIGCGVVSALYITRNINFLSRSSADNDELENFQDSSEEEDDEELDRYEKDGFIVDDEEVEEEVGEPGPEQDQGAAVHQV